MSRWFRHYAGMCRDDKLVRAALRSKQTIERVVWIYAAVLESAAEIDDEGRYEVDAAEIAHFLRCKPAAVEAVLSALRDLDRIDDSTVTAWSRRQFKSDRSNERVAAHRNKKRSCGNSDVTLQVSDGVTLQERHRNSPETETETDITLAKANASNPDKDFWDNAKAYLGAGKGGLINQWIKNHGREATASAIAAAQVERAVDPVAFIQGRWRKTKQELVVGPLC